MSPLDWICPLLAIDADAFNLGGTQEFAAISAVPLRHNDIRNTLSPAPDRFEPIHWREVNGGIDPRPCRQGFYATSGSGSRRERRCWTPATSITTCCCPSCGTVATVRSDYAKAAVTRTPRSWRRRSLAPILDAYRLPTHTLITADGELIPVINLRLPGHRSGSECSGFRSPQSPEDQRLIRARGNIDGSVGHASRHLMWLGLAVRRPAQSHHRRARR